MDTHNTSTDGVPTFKLAKVGKERKRGAAWFSGGRGAGSGFRALGGGAGSGGGALGSSAVAGKIMMIFLVSAVATFGANRLGAALRGDSKTSAGDAKKAFASRGDDTQKYDDLSGVIRGENSIPNSLGYVSGSVDGLTPEERAKKAAEEAAARKAAEEAQKKADEEAAKQAPDGVPVDAAALLAGAGKQDEKPGLKGFNKLSSAFGGSAGGSQLSGGPGLSGGVARGFTAPSAGKAGSIAALKGGARPTAARSTRSAVSPSKSRMFAKRQLLNANKLSRQATSAGKAETASEAAGEAFNGGAPAGTVIEGSGVKTGGLSQGADSTPMSGDTGGSVGSGTPDCTSNQTLNATGTACEDISVPKTGNAAKYQKLLDMVTMLLAATTVLSLLAWAFSKYFVTIGIAQAMVALIGVLGAVIAGIGVMIAAMSGGDFMIGAIVGVVGGYIAATAYMSYATASSGTVLADFASRALVASALGMLTSSMSGAPKND